MKHLALQANWIHPSNTETWLRRMVTGSSLNICCGMSRVGDIRIDSDSKSNRTQDGDLFNLIFEPLSFDTVICDPPFSYYGKFAWIKPLQRITRKRLILSTPQVSIIMMFGRSAWNLSLWAMDGNTPYLRLFYVCDRTNSTLDIK